jgi:nitrate/TMAO reductase-like tetraheme cytochrome c subunit
MQTALRVAASGAARCWNRNPSPARLGRSDSRNCRRCHVKEPIRPAKKCREGTHREAIEKGRTNCIVCHYNLAHNEVAPLEAFLKAAENR